MLVSWSSTSPVADRRCGLLAGVFAEPARWGSGSLGAVLPAVLCSAEVSSSSGEAARLGAGLWSCRLIWSSSLIAGSSDEIVEGLEQCSSGPAALQ